MRWSENRFLKQKYLWQKKMRRFRDLSFDRYLYSRDLCKDDGTIKGIGTELLCTVMKHRDCLNLNVYKKNMRAVVFYQHRGFKIVNQEIDENTSEEEYTMEWHR